MDSELRFLDPGHTEVAGALCEGMTIRTDTAVLGRLAGFVVDPVARRLRYLVVQTSGWFDRVKLLPLAAARVDLDARVIELLDTEVTGRLQPFKRELFPAFSDEDLVAALFSPRTA